MQYNSTQPEAVTARPAKLRPDTYVLYRDVDQLLVGGDEHTRMCRVLDDRGYAPAGKLLLFDLISQRVIQYATADFVRPFDPAEFMADIDTAPLNATGEHGLILSAAAAWLVTHGGRLAGSVVLGELPPAQS
ncbi:hypothetical protein [Streptomyces sp. NRRL S-350]|uniref:hypothetical protein n=1 Tax=Streptomyces sp. NRRL S-350 TaxID=1463902 RepID=UPI0004C0C720|nr:hypothetical protein [Streptomyces sp. NRRL S-350]